MIRLFVFIMCVVFPREYMNAQNSSSSTQNPFVDPSANETSVYIRSEINHYHTVVVNLIGIVDSSSSSLTKDSAVSALREMRAVSAIPTLIKNLTSIRKLFRESSDMVPRISDYSCALALKDIGTPAVDPLINLVKTSDDEAQITIALYTLSSILGKRGALQATQNSFQLSGNGQQEARMQFAMKIFATIDE